MRTYVGRRLEDGSLEVLVYDSGALIGPLKPRFDLRNHSPSGFSAGFCGSGPAQLSLALCCDTTGCDEHSIEVYQRVKFSLVSKLSQDGFDLEEIELRQHIIAARREVG